MLRVWSQCQFAQVHLLLTLSHFPENLPDQTTLFHRTSTELHCAVLALSDPTMLLMTRHCLRLSPILAALHNPKVEKPVCLPELHRNCLHVQLNCAFLKHSHQPSFLPVANLHCSETWVCISHQDYADMPIFSSASLLYTILRNCAELPSWPLLPCSALPQEIAQTCLAVHLLPILHYSQKLRSHA